MLLCKLTPKSPLHLGTKDLMEETSEYIHSDTLFSAFCSAHRTLYGRKKLEEILERFKSNPPFLITSAFPFFGDVLLFPIPKNIDLSKYSEDKKKFKKVKFVSQTLFEKILSGSDISEEIKECHLLQGKIVLVEKDKNNIDFLWKVKETPRITIDRVNSASEIFHVSELVFSKGCGLFFIVKFNDDFHKEFKASINLISQEGIGGERSSGKGLFKRPEFRDFQLETVPSDYHTTLSLCYPSKEEVKNLKDGFYELIKRRGWIYSPDGKNRRRKGIRIIKEGSVYRGNIKGMLKDVTPSDFYAHPVYRYGYSFNVPIVGVK